MKTYFNSLCIKALIVVLVTVGCSTAKAQVNKTHWAADGYRYYKIDGGQVLELDARDSARSSVYLSAAMLTPQGLQKPLRVAGFALSTDWQKVLVFTNTKRVWRYNTMGDYWVYDMAAKTLKQLGKALPKSSLMFAKISPDGKMAAYVSGHNIYAEDIGTGQVKQLTTDGSLKLINGTFDWAYEEEFDCRDGFRWAPDSHSIAYWQIDASRIRNYLMLNTTDSIYPFVKPVEYPVAGDDPSRCRIGVVDITSAQTRWMNVPGDQVQHYIPRMEWWEGDANRLIIEQLNRAQNESRVFVINTANGTAAPIHDEHDKAWIDTKDRWNEGDPAGWEWVNRGKGFIWVSEKDGWRHLYLIDRDGREKLITRENFDVISLNLIDNATGYIYFTASPYNATQKYLYRIKMTGGKAERLTPGNQAGTNEYEVSPNGKIGLHTFSNIYTAGQQETISLPDHRHISGAVIKLNAGAVKKPEFFKVKTANGIKMDGWMVKPANFDPAKKYPVVFYVYSEPAATTVNDAYGNGYNFLYNGSMADDGYIYISLDNRGTPAPKGAEWRKSIYKKIGEVNIEDQAAGAREVLKFPFVDTARVAVWGWSGGGSCTLNLMFQHPEIYKTGIAIAAVGWQLTYDNIYQERYMGVPTDDAGRAVFIKGSPINYAKNLRGNLLYIHGTGDDNVHYKNCEMLINELVKYNKQFQLMSYPNRSHGIYEGPGTREHLSTLYTNYLREHCPPGGK